MAQQSGTSRDPKADPKIAGLHDDLVRILDWQPEVDRKGPDQYWESDVVSFRGFADELLDDLAASVDEDAMPTPEDAVRPTWPFTPAEKQQHVAAHPADQKT